MTLPPALPPLRLQIIVGSTRDGRAVDLLLPWVVRRAQEHVVFSVELLDLRDWPLPMFQENPAKMGDFRNPTYSEPIVGAWNQKLREGDAYVFITPEYNHTIPGVLKNALDNVFLSNALRNKPMAAVGYSGGFAGAVRAVEHLLQIAVEFEMAVLRSSTLVPNIMSAFGDDGLPRDPVLEAGITIMLDDLAWWGRALSSARAGGELAPGKSRLMAARRQAAGG